MSDRGSNSRSVRNPSTGPETRFPVVGFCGDVTDPSERFESTEAYYAEFRAGYGDRAVE